MLLWKRDIEVKITPNQLSQVNNLIPAFLKLWPIIFAGWACFADWPARVSFKPVTLRCFACDTRPLSFSIHLSSHHKLQSRTASLLSKQVAQSISASVQLSQHIPILPLVTQQLHNGRRSSRALWSISASWRRCWHRRWCTSARQSKNSGAASSK